MEVSFSSTFKKAFRKRIKDTEMEAEFWEQIRLNQLGQSQK